MQVQSSTDPPKKLGLGERAVMADGNDYNLIQLKERGQPVQVIYPSEGTPFVTGPTAIFKSAPNPNAARLFQSFLHSRESQQLLVDFARQHSVHVQVTDRPGALRFKNFALLVTSPTFVDPLVTTVILGTSSAVICCALAAPLGWLVARTVMRLRRTIRALVTASFDTPPFLGAIAWELLAAAS